MKFIPANEWPLFNSLFRVYTKWLFKRRFKNIWLHQDYHPDANDKTVYFLNHTSWWDGLIPFLLNEYRFGQRGRAMMEYKQMRAYPFFKYLGAFSSMPHDRSHTLASLRYAVASMQRPNASLYVYPEGEIVPIETEPTFKRGIGWLYQQLPEAHFVPVGLKIHTIRHDKPELNIWIAPPVQPVSFDARGDITEYLENEMRQTLRKLTETAGFEDQAYTRMF